MVPVPRLLMNYELYRRSTLGLALTDSLDELIQDNQLSPQLAMKVLYQFDRTMVDLLNNRVRTRGTIKVSPLAPKQNPTVS